MRPHTLSAVLIGAALVGCATDDEPLLDTDEAALVSGVDLAIDNFAPPASVASRELLTFSWRVTSNGTSTATPTTVPCCAEGYGTTWADAIYVSTDAALSADDALLGKLWRPGGFSLASGASYTATASFQMPTLAPGAYYLIAVADSQGNRVGEVDDSNNAVVVAVTVTRADLTVSAATVPASAGAQELVTLSWTVNNHGTGAASGKYVPCCGYAYYYRWEDAVYLSTDATLSADDLRFGTLLRADQFKVAAGASYTASSAFQLPAVAPGAYQVLIVTDSIGERVDEIDETDNVRAVPITIGRAELAVSALTTPAAAGAGELITVSYTVSNTGTGAASGKYVPCCGYAYYYRWEDAAYLSTDATLSADDVSFATLLRADQFKLAAGASYTVTGGMQLPAASPGSYYVLVKTDSIGERVLEQDENNNVRATPITIGRADLEVASASAPATAGVLQTISATMTVSNAGNGGATGRYLACCAVGYYYRWEDAAFLSTDGVLSADDVKVAGGWRPDQYTLAPGASYTVTFSGTVPEVASGAYQLLLAADATGNRVPESDESDGVVASAITIGRANLAIAEVAVPANPFPGAPVALSWRVVNAGGATATGRSAANGRRWEDALYLSTDAAPSGDDVLLGTSLRADGFALAPGASYTATLAIAMPQVAAGAYYLLAVADATGNRVPETNEADNLGVAALGIELPGTGATAAAPGCDQYPNRVVDDTCHQNCCAYDDLCRIDHDCAGAGAGTPECIACQDDAYVCAGYCVGGMTDCAASACGCGRALCYSSACAAGRTGWCANDCNQPLNDVCDALQRPGESMLGAAVPVTAIPDVVSAGYRFTPKKAGTAVALGGSFAGTRTVRLFRYSTGALLASTSHTSGGTFGYTSIAPIALQAGVTYVVAVELVAGAGSRMSTYSPTPGDYVSLTINCAGTTGPAGAAMPTSCESLYKGMADVEIDFGGAP